VRRIDEQSIASGIPSLDLMEEAGQGAAQIFLDHAGADPGTTVVACGRGNNGGDGLVLARALHLAGCPVVVFWAGGDPSPDCGTNLERVREVGVEVLENLAEALECFPGRWIVDALLGSGFSPPLREPAADHVRALRESGRRIFALDAPTGIDADTGDVDDITPAAERTVVFGPPRLGMFRSPARDLCGRISLVDPGFDPAIVERECSPFRPVVEWIDLAFAAEAWPRRAITAHKYRAGSLLIVGGSTGMSGAAALAGQAAHRAGAGLVEILSPSPVVQVIDGLTPESLVRGLAATERGGFARDLADGILQRADGRAAAVLGCGVGDDPDSAALMVELCARIEGPMVVDADGLNAFERTGAPRRFGRHCVLTPHAGELARLRGVSSAEVEADRLSAAKDSASAFECTVLLKGSPTVVADPGGRVAFVGSGGPELATAGTGDVLAGTIGALLAAGLAPFDAAATGAWVHGRAGERLVPELGTAGVVAGDLPLEIALVGRELEEAR
jgi:NAD(P)H-hydrate epimerase